MDSKTLKDTTHFSTEKMQKVNLFASSNMCCDIYCLEPGQLQKVHSHNGNDKIYYVIEGTGEFTVGKDVQILRAGQIVCAFSGEPHGVENTSQKRLVCLVFMAPNPSRKRTIDLTEREEQFS